MIQTQAKITHKETIGPAWWRFEIAAHDLFPRLQPGQFLLLRCADRFTCYLRRPIFPAQLHPTGFSLLLRPDPDPGQAWLLSRQPGDQLDLIGPLGNGFPRPEGRRNLLLVSDLQTIGPLVGYLEQAVGEGLAVTLALGASRAAELYPVTTLPPQVEFQAATLDGSLGQRGQVTALLPELLTWADLVITAGSDRLYQALKAQTEKIRFRPEAGFLYGLMTGQPMACGVGACYSCALETPAGLKLTCLDGPVFDLVTWL